MATRDKNIAVTASLLLAVVIVIGLPPVCGTARDAPVTINVRRRAILSHSLWTVVSSARPTLFRKLTFREW